jgi:Domain of unknown function (DUF4352)
MRKLTVAAAVVAITFVVASCAETTPELVDQVESASEETDPDAEDAGNVEDAEDAEASGEGDESYRIGDTVAMGDLEHTLHGARWSDGDEWFGPEGDERWLVVDIEIANTGDSSEPISSILMWTLVDADNRSVDVTLTGDERGSLDGELGAGRSMRGETTFSLTDDGNRWELVFEPNLFGFGQAIYVIDSDDVTEN